MTLLDTHTTTILEHMNDGFVAFDTQWRYVYVNTTAEAILQQEREDLIGHEVQDVFPSIATTLFAEKCLQAVETREVVEFESYHESLTMWIHVRACPVTGGLFTYFHDITAHKLVNQQVDETLAFLVEGAPFGFGFFDTDLRFRHVNKQMTRIHNKSKEEHLGRKLGEILSRDNLSIESSEIVRIVQGVLDSDQPVINLEINGIPIPETGEIKHWQVSYYPVHSLTGDLLGVSTYVLDITDQKILEQRKDDFINMASHELKTPLTALKTMVQMLKRRLAKQDLQEHVASANRMDSQIDTLTKLVTELLDVSKMRSGKLEYTDNLVDINELLHDLVETLQLSTPQHQIILTGQTCRPIHGDKDRLEQVFTNLLTNAIKYSPEANRVSLHIDTCKSAVIVRVRDYGIGIPKDVQKHIFERFYRVQRVRDNNFPGLGMGLYIVEAIVKRHGGTISVESEEGEGSTFSVTLPY